MGSVGMVLCGTRVAANGRDQEAQSSIYGGFMHVTAMGPAAAPTQCYLAL
jgi:hypothetical protein